MGPTPVKRKTTQLADKASKKVKGQNFYHDAKTANRIKMLKGGKPTRDTRGKVVQAAAFQKGEDETEPGRVQPDRRWFGASIESPIRPHALKCGRQYTSHFAKSVGSFQDQSCWEERRSVLGPTPPE